MAHLIDKAAVVAEIKKRFDEYSSNILKHYDACTEARTSELGKILVMLNTFEVKEVDLEEEIKLNYNPADGLEFEEYKRIAKYYFELGLKAQKRE